MVGACRSVLRAGKTQKSGPPTHHTRALKRFLLRVLGHRLCTDAEVCGGSLLCAAFAARATPLARAILSAPF